MNEPFLTTGRPAVSLASILTHIVVYFDCLSTLTAHSAVDIQKYFQNSEMFSTFSNLFCDIDLIKRALLNKYGREVLSKYYNIEFLRYRTSDDLIDDPYSKGIMSLQACFGHFVFAAKERV